MKEKESAIKPEAIIFTPETNFQLADTEEEAEIFYDFLKNDRGKRWTAVFRERFPDLVREVEEISDKERVMEICRNFTKDQHAILADEMLSAKKSFESAWGEISVTFLSTLSKHFETEWPQDKKISGSISILPVFPRNLDDYSFYVGYKNIPGMIETAAHEIVHFLWFKKWKEVFPEMKRREYESPHLAWRLSEIIDPIILQCNPKICELVKPKGWGYSSFNKIKIGDLGLVEHFKKVYLHSIESGNNFATTMKILWEAAQKYEEEIAVF